MFRMKDILLSSLSNRVKLVAQLLISEIEILGPNAVNWPNYGKLQGRNKDLYHCHLIKGKPTYVACWEVLDKSLKLIEVYYVGTHEKAKY